MRASSAGQSGTFGLDQRRVDHASDSNPRSALYCNYFASEPVQIAVIKQCGRLLLCSALVRRKLLYCMFAETCLLERAVAVSFRNTVAV